MRKKVGLVLGGGGPRGLAHIGVIKVLEENNIPIDFIAGTSIGAMIGGFYAHTRDIKKVEEIALGVSKRKIFSLLDPSFKDGLLGGDKIKKFIENNIDKVDFDDLKIPLSIVATDFKSGEAVIIDNGDVASAIRASISLPLIFKPIKRGGKLLVDGGLSLPVPVEVVRDMGADLIIAVNLNADFFSDNDNAEKKLTLYKTAENSINLLQHNLSYQNVRGADIVIVPKVGKTSWTKFLDGGEVIVTGEDSTREMIPQIKEMLERDSGIFEKIKDIFN